MKIYEDVYRDLMSSVQDFPPETGGILGSGDGAVITELMLDTPSQYHSKGGCSYAPNVSFLNSCISDWQKKGIRFAGLFHTHFADVQTLSSADLQYISVIMHAMPEEIEYLYFPIIALPGRILVSYMARKGSEYVEPDRVTIIPSEKKINETEVI